MGHPVRLYVCAVRRAWSVDIRASDPTCVFYRLILLLRPHPFFSIHRQSSLPGRSAMPVVGIWGRRGQQLVEEEEMRKHT